MSRAVGTVIVLVSVVVPLSCEEVKVHPASWGVADGQTKKLSPQFLVLPFTLRDPRQRPDGQRRVF